MFYAAISEGGEGTEQSSPEWEEAREEGGSETETGEVRDMDGRERVEGESRRELKRRSVGGPSGPWRGLPPPGPPLPPGAQAGTQPGEGVILSPLLSA